MFEEEGPTQPAFHRPGAGIPSLTLTELRKQTALLERLAGPPTPEALAAGAQVKVGHTFAEQSRYGWFSAVYPASIGEPKLRLKWNPGTEAFFPTYDQMAEARAYWLQADAWDFSALRVEGQIYGLPLEF